MQGAGFRLEVWEKQKVRLMDDESSDGDHGAAGQDCPAELAVGQEGKAESGKAESGNGHLTEGERAVIRRFLDDGGGAGMSRRTSAVVWAALKFVAMLLVAGVAIAVGDGNEFDGVDCGVAAKPPGREIRKAEIGKSENRESPGGRPPGESGKALAGGHHADVVEMLAGIREEIAAVRSEFVELRTSKERLERMLADGLFGFAQKVDGRAFKVLCTILAEGDVAKASRALGVADGSLRTLMRRWRKMGKEYLAMLELVRWRKAVGRREVVALSESVLLERAPPVDCPGLLADVLDGLLSMTQENWRERCEELAELLRPAAGG